MRITNLYLTFGAHIRELIDLIKKTTTTLLPNCKLFIVGDFNIDMLQSKKSQSTLVKFMQYHKLTQVVNTPTTQAGTLLDQIWIQNIDPSLPTFTPLDAYWSAHFAVSLWLPLQHKQQQKA